MTVVKSKRGIAFSEFEWHMAAIVRETKQRLNPVPARYRKFIYPRIYEPTSRAYTAVILANEINARTEEGKGRRSELLEGALKDIRSLQTPLYGAWNILGTKEESCKDWADMLNREIALITGVINKERAVDELIQALPKKKIERLEFLKVMAQLHKYTYTKIGHAPNDCKDFISMKIAELTDTALCEILKANGKIPETGKQATERARHVQGAIDNLNAMQRPLYALWNIVDYSENEMDEWAGLIDREIRLLEGLKKSDRERFKNLK